VMLVLR